MSHAAIPTRMFGKTGMEVTCVGLGGEGILRTHGNDKAAHDVIREAVEQGITYFDCAKAYAGSEAYYGAIWAKYPGDRARIFQASKSARRDKAGALAELHQTLKTMKIDHLDLWQIHDVRTDEDLQRIAGPGGALEAFEEARAAGKIRFIGVTGHHDPRILTKAVREWPVDSVMLPVNPVEGVLGGFLDGTLSAAREKGMAVIGMKVLGASYYVAPDMGITAEALIRFALSQPITVAIIGCSTVDHVRTLRNAGSSFEPLSTEEQQEFLKLFGPHAGRLAYYRGVL